MERKEILTRNLSFRGLMAFWKQVQEAILDGYVIREDKTLMVDAPVCMGLLRVVLFKGDDQELKSEDEEITSDDVHTLEADVDSHMETDIDDSKEELDIDSIKSKEDLLEFAKNKGIEIPEDVTHPKSIKKFIKDNLDLS